MPEGHRPPAGVRPLVSIVRLGPTRRRRFRPGRWALLRRKGLDVSDWATGLPAFGPEALLVSMAMLQSPVVAMRSPRSSGSSGLLRGCSSGRARLLHAVGLAVGGDDGGVVQEAVEKADGGRVFGDEPSPVLEWPVRRDAERASFVGAGDEPEEQLGARVVERGEPDLVDQDEVRKSTGSRAELVSRLRTGWTSTTTPSTAGS